MKILLYPDTHHKRYKITKLKLFVELLGIDLADGIEDDYDVLLYWSYHKFKRKLDEFLLEESKKRHIINLGGWDTTKTYNEEVMMKAFGYNTVIDPATYQGRMLEKSEIQGAHSMVEIGNRKRKKDNYIYVKLLDNRTSDNMVRDYRVYVCNNNITLVIIKDRSIDDRFKGTAESVIKTCDSPKDVFSDDEIRKIGLFCKIYDTEFTELDVIRDNDGRLYVVDNNNMPAYSRLTWAEFEKENNKILNYSTGRFYEMLEKYVI